MATYAVFTSSPSYITLEFNSYSEYNNYASVRWQKDEFAMVYLLTDGAVGIRAKHGAIDYTFSYDGSRGMRVETVNGVTPSSASNLYDLLSALM